MDTPQTPALDPACAPGPAASPPGRKGMSIFTRIVLCFLAVNVTTSFFLTLITYSFNTGSIEKHARSSITQQLQTIQQKFDQTYRVHLDRSLRSLIASSLLDDYLFSSSAESSVAKKRLQRLFQRTADDSEGFDSLMFVDFDGKVQIHSARRHRQGMRVSGRERAALDDPALASAIARLFDRVAGSPMLLSSGNMEWFMPPREMQVEGPLLDAEGKLFALVGMGKLDHDTADFGGVVAIRLSLEPLLEELREIAFFDTRPLWLFDSAGHSLLRPGEDEPTFNPRQHLPSGFQGHATLESVSAGLVGYQDFSIAPGETFVRIAAAVPDSVLMRDTLHALQSFAVVLLASVVFVLIASLYVSRYLTRPIVELAGAATRLARGEQRTRVGFRTTGEVQTLIDSFNRMAEDLRQTMDARDASVRSLEREVVERKRAETALKLRADELTEARVAAEAADGAKSEFLATMSHEIRTPINGVLGMTELLLTTALDAKQNRLVRTARRSVLTLLGLINDILDFSKIEAGKLELIEEPFDLRELVEDLGQMFAESAHRKSIELVCDLPDDLPTRLRADAPRLRQVLTNLVGNALKFTDAGEVLVRVTRERDDGERVELRFEVSDTGIGIPDPSRIFEAFSQGDSSATRRYGGTGLGLGISRQLVKLMGGTIDFESRAGLGSVFWFTISIEKAVSDGPEPSEPAAPLAGHCVLVVEDNNTHRESLERRVGALGANVEGVADALQALVALKADGRHDLVVVDEQMPGMSGPELIAAVRSNPALRPVPIVLMASVDDGGARSTMHEPDATLAKPVRQSELRACLVALLRGEAYTPEDDQPHSSGLEGHRGVHGRVLIAEDNPVNQEMAEEIVKLLGADPVVVDDGLAALTAIEEGAFDLVLMDCQMPRMDGFEATRAIRAREAEGGGTRRTPIVALTANAFASQRERCLDAGMDDYLAKPFTIAALRAVMSRWLPGAPPVDTPAPERPAGGAGASGLDPAALENIRSLQRQGADDVMKRYVALYEATTGDLLHRLREAAAAGDAAELNEAAHSLKSSSANVGATALATACRELEALTAQGRLDGADVLIVRIEAAHAEARALLTEECEKVRAA